MCFNLYLRHHTPTEHDIEKCPRCEEARIMRRILARWLNLAGVLTFRDVSQCVKDRFPTLDHIKSAGFLTLPELELYENTKTVHLKYWIPFIWFTRNVQTSFFSSKSGVKRIRWELVLVHCLRVLLQNTQIIPKIIPKITIESTNITAHHIPRPGTNAAMSVQVAVVVVVDVVVVADVVI